MRKIILMPLLLLLVLCVACEKDNDNEGGNERVEFVDIITEGPIAVNADENVVTIEFSSTSDWEAVVVTSDNGDWCSIDKKSGTPFPIEAKSEAVTASVLEPLRIVATINPNTSSVERSATITINSTVDTEEKRSITINQAK